MPRLSTYSIEQLRAKAKEARDFAQRCEDEADKKESVQLTNALLRSAKEMGVPPAKVIKRLSKVRSKNKSQGE